MGILEGLGRQQIMKDGIGAAVVVRPVVDALARLDGVWVKSVLFLTMVDHDGLLYGLIFDFLQPWPPITAASGFRPVVVRLSFGQVRNL